MMRFPEYIPMFKWYMTAFKTQNNRKIGKYKIQKALQ